VKFDKMKYLPLGYNTKDLEKHVKNKWRWEWLNEVEADGGKWGQWLKKPEISGVGFCEACGRTINYQSSGKKALRIHADDANHKKKVRTIKTNQVFIKTEKAKRISKLVKLKNRLMAKSNKPLKRRAEDSLTSQRKKQWKRIKVVI